MPPSRRLLGLVVAALVALTVPVTAQAGVASAAAKTTINTNNISRSGSTLMLHGKPYRFTGQNAYELATLWSVNHGCGSERSDAELDAFFAGLRPDSVVRFWAFQSLGVNKSTLTVDWTGIDRVFAAAAKYKQRLIPVLGNQDGACDNTHWLDKAWYAGGYNSTFNDNGLNVMSYGSWVTAVVNRYKSSPALGMWEPINEAESDDCLPGYGGGDCWGHKTCPADAATALRSFFDTVGSRIKSIDKTHLISSGLMGGGQCGTAWTEYTTVNASPYVDVATYHDYGADTVAVPTGTYNGLTLRISQAHSLNKPIFTEEVGIKAGPTGAVLDANGLTLCVDTTTRDTLYGAKLTGQLAAGVAGFLPWFGAKTMPAGCSHNIVPGDPVLTRLHNAAL
jgi:hypothetical protein